MKKTQLLLAAFVSLSVVSLAVADPRNFRHERIVASYGFEGNGAAITNMAQSNVVGLVSSITALNDATNAQEIVIGDLRAATNSLNTAIQTGLSVGGHTLYVWNGSTCSTYNVSADGLTTNWMGDTYP